MERALIVEDNPDLALLLKGLLESSSIACESVSSARHATRFLKTQSFDIIILDLGLPDGDGIGLLKRIRSDRINVPVLILSARGGLDDRILGLDTGADDYLTKPFDPQELMAHVRAVLRRPQSYRGTQLQAGNLVLDLATRGASVGTEPLVLGRAELVLLESLMRSAGLVVSRESVSDRLAELDLERSENALHITVHRLRRKLESAGASVGLNTIRGVGFLLK
ncbi:MAG: response regulator [Lysobacteraceae bacterium]|jgi:DNA-binding response OmpR family regulator|nr:response regulator [Silanimonas sp.]